MKIFRLFSAFLVAFGISSMMMSCENNDDVNIEENAYDPENPNIPKISFVTNESTATEFTFWLKSSQNIAVDWGDYQKTTYQISNPNGEIIKGNLVRQLVKIYVNSGKSITTLNLEKRALKQLDIQNAIGLENLMLENNKLSSLDISKNTNLEFLDLGENKFKTEDLDNVLKSLPNRNTKTPGEIIIGDGADGNERPSAEAITFAKNMNWKVNQD